MKNDDIETLRILFSATIGELCNQERWNDAKEMEGIKDRLIQALESQSEDCISRQAILNEFEEDQYHLEFCIEHGIDRSISMEMVRIRLHDMPSVNPQRSGKWTYIGSSDVYGMKVVECSSCRKRIFGGGKFCSNCGSYNGGE